MLQTLLAIAIVVSSLLLLLRRADVRLILALSAFALFALSGKIPDFFVKMAAEMAKPDTVVPICAAVGFAYVLKQTGCDQHLVQALLRTLRQPSARPLLIPGGIVIGYLVNMAIVSQTGVAAVVGPILIPLLLANGITRNTAGSLLLLGASMGGELFNPGAVEMVTLADVTKVKLPELMAQMAPVNMLACTVALLVYWRLALHSERQDRVAAGLLVTSNMQPLHTTLDAEKVEGDTITKFDEQPNSLGAFQNNPVKAAIPLIPLLLLIFASRLALPKEFNSYITILFAMLVGVAAAGFAAPRQAKHLSGAFFEGAGYAYTHVISLIVTATLFAEGIKYNNLIKKVISGVSDQPMAAMLASMALPWLMATLSGSGIAPAVAVMKSLIPSAVQLHLDPVQLGILSALSAHFGRTMSPVAAVTVMCAALSGTQPAELVRRVILPLFAGGLTLFLIAFVRLLIA